MLDTFLFQEIYRYIDGDRSLPDVLFQLQVTVWQNQVKYGRRTVLLQADNRVKKFRLLY